MIQVQTTLDVADNTGARSVMCIKVLGGSKRRYAGVGDIIKVSIKDAAPRGRVGGRQPGAGGLGGHCGEIGREQDGRCRRDIGRVGPVIPIPTALLGRLDELRGARRRGPPRAAHGAQGGTAPPAATGVCRSPRRAAYRPCSPGDGHSIRRSRPVAGRWPAAPRRSGRADPMSA